MENGSTLADGRYTILEQLGQGTLGPSYLAREARSGIPVVIKPMPQEVTREERELGELIRHFQLVHSLEHPHIASAHTLEYDAAKSFHFLVLEHVEGLNLQDFLSSQPEGKVPVSVASGIVRQLADALDFTHRTTLHRNLKPENIILGPKGDIKLLDFQLVSDKILAACATTGAKGRRRTQHYMAPEYYYGFPPPGPAADRYALAAIFHELVSGRPPFQSEDFQELRNAVCKADPTPLKELSRRQNSLLMQSLAKDPGNRPATAGEFASAVNPPLFASSGLPWKSAILVGLLLAGGYLWHTRPPTTENPSTPVATILERFQPPPPVVEPPAPAKVNEVNKTATRDNTLVLRIRSRPGGAKVLLDGKPLGNTPFVTGRVPVGNHLLRLEKQNYQPFEMDVNLSADTIVDLSLDPLPPDTSPVERESPTQMAMAGSSASAKSSQKAGLTRSKTKSGGQQSTASAAPSRDSRKTASKTTGTTKSDQSQEKVTQSAQHASNQTQKAQQAAQKKEATQKAAQEAEQAAQREDRIDDLVARAEADLDAWRLSHPPGNNALEKFRQVLDLDPNNTLANDGLKRIVNRYLDLARNAGEDMARVERHLELASAIIPDDPGIALFREELIEGPTADEQDPTAGHEEVQELLAEARQDMRSLRLTRPEGENALEKYEAVLKLDPGNSEAQAGIDHIVAKLVPLARADLNSQRLTRPKGRNALHKYRQILRLDPDNPDGRAGVAVIVEQLLTLAEVDITQKRLSQPEGNNAFFKYRTVLELDPGNQKANEGLQRIANRYHEMAQKEEPGSKSRKWFRGLAKAVLAKQSDATSSSEVTPVAAAKSTSRSQRTRATQTYGSRSSSSSRIEASAETDTETTTGQTSRNKSQTKTSTATSGIKTAPPADPKTVQRLLDQGRKYLYANRLTRPEGENALDSYQKALYLDPDNSRGKAGLTIIAKRLVAFGDKDLAASRLTRPPGRNALARYTKALEIDPDNEQAKQGINAIVENYLARADRAGSTNPQSASQYLDRAEAISPQDPRIRQAREKWGLEVRDNWSSRESTPEEVMADSPPLRADEESFFPEETTSDEADLATENLPVEQSPEEVDRESASPPLYNPPSNQLWRDATTGMAFVQIPGGCDKMGSNHGDFDEAPVHDICLDSYWMGRHEVTQGQWNAVMGAGNNPSKFRQGDNYPVETVSWKDVQGFIQRLNTMGPDQFRLPTEAEWEFACRVGKAAPFHFGGTITASQANYNGTYTYKNESPGEYRRATTPVGQFPPNGFGLFDLHGNVYEWVADQYEKDYYGNSPRDNPQGGNSLDDFRILRGGAWYSNPGNLRCSYRYRGRADNRNYGNGFRLVRLDDQP
ncbi:MAG: SUMF1/EgtB/PvdO family nonheme iron enzyme [Magnetococcales bacterium]|nr:SUMF1/EgtB/PvdO family nonheme iron enzyme [Magnetococcales bacterium]